MKYCKKLWLKYHIRKDRRILLKAGVQEAARQRKNIQVGLDSKLIINEDPLERIYLPQERDGMVDLTPIIYLGAKENPGSARRFFIYNRMLERLEDC